jgi:hypothetical protein
MDGRAFLLSAQHLLSQPNEANWRSAAGRLYLALLHEAQAALARWGFPRPSRRDIHTFVNSRFGSTPNIDLLRVGDALVRLKSFAENADLALATVGPFANAAEISLRMVLAQVTIDLLDQIENDPVRRTTAIGNIQARWP